MSGDNRTVKVHTKCWLALFGQILVDVTTILPNMDMNICRKLSRIQMPIILEVQSVLCFMVILEKRPLNERTCIDRKFKLRHYMQKRNSEFRCLITIDLVIMLA